MLPEKLSELRKKKGLSQIELAEKLNVSRQAVSRWETGGALPSVENLLSLRELYNVSLDEMVGADIHEQPGSTPVTEPPEEPGENVPRHRRGIWPMATVAVTVLCAAVLIAALCLRSAESGKLDDPLANIDGPAVIIDEGGEAIVGKKLDEYKTYYFEFEPFPEPLEEMSK